MTAYIQKNWYLWLRVLGYVGLIVALILAVDAKDTANRVADQTQSLVLYLQCENNQQRNLILLHTVEAFIVQRQIDLLYADTNGVYSWANTELDVLSKQQKYLQNALKENCLKNLRTGVYGPPVHPPLVPKLDSP